jgi:acyl-CoA dehydrogenase
MNFDFSDEQKELRRSAAAMLREHASFTRVRKAMDAGEGIDRALWGRMAEQGWQATAIPEAYGGSGFGYLELVQLAYEIGYAVAPVPFSSSVYLCTEAILLAGSEDQKRTYLPKLASGEVIGTLAIAEGPGVPRLERLECSVHGGSLSGTKTPVTDAPVADLAVVVAKDATLTLVDLRQTGVACAKLESMDGTRSHGRLDFEGAPAEVLGAPGQAASILDALYDRAAVLVAFEQIGGATRAMEMARDYAKTRYAFGRPIGSFQAIKHRIVDMLVNNEIAVSDCYYAAWALENATNLPIAAATARIAATDAFEFAARENIQVHGGIGFTWECDAHLLFKRSKLLALSLGSASEWRDELIDRIAGAA